MSSMIDECATTDKSAERPVQCVRVRAGAQRAASRAVGASPRLPSAQSCACASLVGRAAATGPLPGSAPRRHVVLVVTAPCTMG
ncbi:hypothetical protein [Burkholderia multivorans]|uniref:hypothetical protein n=1 Tax=Burkholderia multivorans TaxID=87883 RepID=UPI000D010ED8|nr:hypothetical protein [Burkholderia multivorans]MBR8239893.1 hypothetical protein [Burkholderia multivorans]PRG40630.1 hypothetical protein C6T52_03790 [Burkholderia multivorans]